MAAATRRSDVSALQAPHLPRQDSLANWDSFLDDDDDLAAGSTAGIINSPPPPYYHIQDPPNIRCKRCRSLGNPQEPPADAAALEARKGGPQGRSGREGGPHPSWRSRVGSDCAGCVEGSRCRRLDDGSLACTKSCLADEWACKSGLCVSKHSRCDGLADCDDLSDESSCPCDEDVNFRCGLNTSCLPLDRRCDGRADCWDIADEVHCPVEECPPGDPKPYHCHSWHCISSELVCDGQDDCDDGSDEGGCPSEIAPKE
ncbi:hypothetical protein HPB51_022801 [Rhipicephalus microplus]|uniref:Uncharacterized protein n=1 Tax=Rhipicephalus microplus TaxID=6941 RepID=A0A9J6ED63_RHIMP|nr:hypothetical protein HPB51_022801 [Rhipicephalus microplus]